VIDLMHAKITHTHAALRRISDMPRGLYSVDILNIEDLIELPEEGKGTKFPRKPAILAVAQSPQQCTSCDHIVFGCPFM